MENPDEKRDWTGYEYDALMNLMQVSVSKHLLDNDYTLVWANKFYYEMFGYSKEEYEAVFLNKPTLYYMNDELGIHDEALWNQLGAAVNRALESGENGYSLVTQMRRKSGEYIWVRVSARFADEYVDGYQVSYSAITDITDAMSMKMEQTVTYDSLPGFVAKFKIGADFDLTLLEANRQFFAFFGEDSTRNMQNPLFRENLERNMPILLEQQEAISKKEPVHFIVRMSDQFGKDAWLQMNASYIGDQEGDPVYLVIYLDITNETELRQMQQQLEIQAEQLRGALRAQEAANRAKSEFLSRMSHDIRTPLNAILGMKDIADFHLDNPAKVKDCLKKIGLSGQHLLALINDVLDMSKIESGEMSLREDIVSLPETLENIVTIMQPQFKAKEQEFSIRLQCVVHEQLQSDALRVRQIFINLLSNACKFTPMGGKISVDVRELSCENGIARFSFTIADTGIGMQPEFMAHLFEAFSREQDSRVDKTEGTGLGLAITKKVVDLLGGEIKVKSTPGEGTAFCVTLPMKIANMQLTTERLPDLKILVADDDAILCEYTMETLHQIGIHADFVRSGAQAVEKAKASMDEGRLYDAILLDWKMPGQDGIETTRQLRELCGTSLPVLIISAYDWSEAEGSMKDSGVTAFIQKPIFISTLIHGLQHYVLRETPASKVQSVSRKTGFAGRRFLLVEDNALNQEVARELLMDMGAKIEIVSDGAQGVEAFRKSAAGYYDLILMDIQMPVMNGYEAARAIRRLDHGAAQTIPILAMTADAFAEDIWAAKDAGMNGHLAKPLDRAIMEKEIGKYV